MILLREQNQQQQEINQQKVKSHNSQITLKNCNHKVTRSQIVFYSCCYQLACQKCISKNDKFKSKHQCKICVNRQQCTEIIPLSFVATNLNQQKCKKTEINSSKKIDFQCSVCQKTNQNLEKQSFYQCLNCKKQFCQKCCSIIHGKGKFMSHQINQISQKNLQNFNTQNKQKGKLLKNELQKVEISLLEENINFSQQYFNEIYHNQANKLSEVKQVISKFYKDAIERLEQRYLSNMNQLQKLESGIKSNFSKNLQQIKSLCSEIQVIKYLKQSTSEYQTNNILDVRLQCIQQNLGQIQSRSEQLIAQLGFDYRIGDKDKNVIILDQLLKSFTVIKTKRPDQDGMSTYRSSLKNNLRTSRTSRQSSSKMTTSKDNRYNSSFKKNQNTSSSKYNNSSFKDKDRISFSRNDSGRKKQDLTSSVTNRSSMGKSVDRPISMQQSENSSRNTSTFFKEKNINDVKQLEKAQYQDLNLNLKKMIINKKASQVSKNPSFANTQRQSQNTSLEKQSKQAQNPLKKHLLTKQNQKSTINSGSFLKIFDNKSKASARKNYLVSSGEDLEQNSSNGKQRISKIQVITSNMKIGSPQNHSQLKRNNIKNQIYGSSSGSNKFSPYECQKKVSQNGSSVYRTSDSKNQILQSQSRKSEHRKSVIFDNLVAISSQKQNNSQINQFNLKCPQNLVEKFNGFDTIKSEVSQFSSMLVPETQENQITSKISNVQMTTSINISQKHENKGKVVENYPKKQQVLTKRSRSRMHQSSKVSSKQQITKQPTPPALKLNYTKQSQSLALNPSSVFKDATNTLVQKTQIQKTVFSSTSASVNNDKMKKKPDFMDMREKMRKPNYLSSRLGTNMSTIAPKSNEVKK